MATKKSSSAAKKKAAPKKQAAKKKSNTVKKQSVREESAALYTNDESAQASLQSAVTHSEPASEKQESGNGIYLFLVLAGVAAIGYLGYAKYVAKKNQVAVEPAKVETTTTPVAPKVEESKPEVTEAPTAPEEAVASATSAYLVDKIGTKKKWTEAAAYCKEIGASLPSKQELGDFAKNASKELKNSDKYWSSNESAKSKEKAISIKLETGANFAEPKSTKNKVLCKN
ncbi:hypothetical protein [Leptospira idonii]|uniref:Uncharacterized protein n=1 Tax=Leptospira idonii TaxID=1193500 RepID=A0A4R9M3A9_9LEPT|nr:hypothetical protein [Leptospira idonii]TGN20375.1 hypothetical protein EHS15_03965 [Leptospira idonii]